MSSSTANSQYILLFRGHDWDRGLTPEQIRQTLDRMMAWSDGLQQRGVVRGGSPLARTGAIVSHERGEVVVDGPYAESKEILGGFLMLEAGGLDEAMAIARQYPGLKLGIEIEVRPVLAECPIATRLREQSALAAA